MKKSPGCSAFTVSRTNGSSLATSEKSQGKQCFAWGAEAHIFPNVYPKPIDNKREGSQGSKVRALPVPFYMWDRDIMTHRQVSAWKVTVLCTVLSLYGYAP